MEEIDAFEGEAPEHDWQKTSLRPSFEAFVKTFLGPMWKDVRRAERDRAEAESERVSDDRTGAVDPAEPIDQ